MADDQQTKLYIDSRDGEGDNKKLVRDMAILLQECDWIPGEDFMYYYDQYKDQYKERVPLTHSHRPEDIPLPRADALTPVRPTAKEQDIAIKMKSDAQRVAGQAFSNYEVAYYIKSGNKYCFRICVDIGLIDVYGKYAFGKVSKVTVRSVSSSDIMTMS